MGTSYARASCRVATVDSSSFFNFHLSQECFQFQYALCMPIPGFEGLMQINIKIDMSLQNGPDRPLDTVHMTMFSNKFDFSIKWKSQRRDSRTVRSPASRQKKPFFCKFNP
jgi:hypothetical protein